MIIVIIFHIVFHNKNRPRVEAPKRSVVTPWRSLYLYKNFCPRFAPRVRKS